MDSSTHSSAQTGYPSSYSNRKRLLLPDRNGDPTDMMGSIFNLAVLMGVGLMVMALSSIGLGDYFSTKPLTLVKDPGSTGMEIITHQDNAVTRLKTTGKEAEGAGTVLGTVYRLQDGSIVWVPGTNATP
jgi:hypothetical protein